MSGRLVVHTECPTCGAPLDFSEGSNAIQCKHCRSNLLVTGRGQVLSYAVSPRLDRHGAIVRTNQAHRQSGQACRVVKTQLYFIPYFRLTGQDFRLQRTVKERPSGITAFSGHRMGHLSYGQLAVGGIGLFSGRSPLDPRNEGDRHFRLDQAEGEIQFQDRYVEKNFAACELRDLNLHSLGIRPSVIRLELYRREVLEEKGKVVAACITPAQALKRAMKTIGAQEIRHRQVLGRVLSLIYFPFWVVEVRQRQETHLTVLDAVSRSVVQLNAPVSAYEVLDRPPQGRPHVIGFRPLTCPNCGWDFAVRPDDVIFFCGSCDRAWQIRGSGLRQTPYEIAAVKEEWKKQAVKHLPFWIVQAVEADGKPRLLYLPAFRYRRLKYIGNLARALSKMQPRYEVVRGRVPELHGCFYGQEDAALFARFTLANLSINGMPPTQKSRSDDLPLTGAKLVWIPFRIGPHSYIDPFSGLGLPKSLLQ